MSHSSPIRVTAAVIRRSGQVLLARRGSGGHLEGRWEFPGGKIEPGESPEHCLARELEEELGVRARVGRFLLSSRHSYDAHEIELLAYEVELPRGPIALSSHDEVRWVAIGELLRYDLAPADVPIARALASSAELT